ncbi:MAG: hypothetical protein HeimC3_49580 [Candidatus Heimdallarchaeota archaeon LC_3]|nr:MAG: hypothetical protein HeimC3_49580 [Candidatus Heimdallarchaeota archaeon LC_3]
MQQKILIIIENPIQYQIIQNSRYKISMNDDFSKNIILANEPEAQQSMIQFNIPFKTIYDYFSNDELEKVNEKLDFISKNFYQLNNNIKKAFTLKQINYGFVFSWNIDFFLHNVTRRILTIYKCILYEKPKKIICFRPSKQFEDILEEKNDSITSRIVEKLSEVFNIPVRYYNEPESIEIEDIQTKLKNLFSNIYYTRLLPKIQRKHSSSVFFHAINVNKLGNVYEYLINNNINVVVYPSPNIGTLRRFLPYSNRISSVDSKELYGKTSLQEETNLRKIMNKRKQLLTSDNEFKNLLNSIIDHLVDIPNFNLWDIVLYKFDFLFTNRIPKFFLTYKNYYHFYKKKGITGIIVNNQEQAINKLAILTAKQLKIRSLHHFHGYYDDYSLNIMKSIVDIECVWGKKTKDDMVRLKYQEKKIYVIGNPQFDSFFEENTVESIVKQRNQKKNNTDINIIYATAWYKNSTLKIFRHPEFYGFYKTLESIARFISEQQQLSVTFTLKLHPTDQIRIEYYKNLLSRLKIQNYSITKTSDNFALVKKGDILITIGFSSIILESLIVNTPAIVSVYNNPYLIEFPNSISIFSANPSNLPEKLYKILNKKGLQNIKKLDYTIKIDKYSSLRLFKAIKLLIE